MNETIELLPDNDFEVKYSKGEVEMEKCILCDCETQVPRNRHVSYRENYVEGAGQLCPPCYSKTYKF